MTEHTPTNDCFLCKEPIRDPHSLPCSHSFCNSCVGLWLSVYCTCPICKCKVPSAKPISDQSWGQELESEMSIEDYPGYSEYMCGYCFHWWSVYTNDMLGGYFCSDNEDFWVENDPEVYDGDMACDMCWSYYNQELEEEVKAGKQATLDSFIVRDAVQRTNK